MDHKKWANVLSNYLVPCLILLCLITAFFALTIGRLMPEKAQLVQISELDQYDLSSQYVKLSNASMDQYPAKLYTPADFADGLVTEEPRHGIDAARYGTARGLLHLTPGVTYGVTGSTAAYSQRLWIDGTLVLTSGEVSDSRDTFTPDMRYFTVYFTPTEEYTEFVTQYALFNHVRGGFPFTIGEAPVIERQNRSQYLCDGIFTGALCAIGVFLVGMFLFNKKQRTFLYLGLACLCTCAHYLIYDHKNIMMLFPNLNWYFGHKLEYMADIFYYVFIILFAYSLLKAKMPKRLAYPMKCGVGIVILFYLVAPSYIYTRYNIPLMAIAACSMIVAYLYLLVFAVRKRAYRKPENVIVLITLLLASAAGILTAVNYIPNEVYTQPFITVLFAFLNSVVLTLSFARTERALDLAKQKEREIAETNEMLSRMDALKTEFLREISHEMKTPLTVMSGYAQLTGWQLKEHTTSDDTAENLNTISSEAQRLSDLVTKLVNLSFEKQGLAEKRRVPVAEVLDAAAAVCKPILVKNGNSIACRCEQCPDVLANREMLLQVLINLAINANKHARDSVIRFFANADEADQEMVLFRVCDQGDGVRPEDRERIFERGFSRDAGSGLGLSICKDVAETHGGRIFLEPPQGDRGTVVCFTIPRFNP